MRSTALLLLLLSSSSVFAQERQTAHTVKLAGASPEPATIEDFSWLAGRWTGNGLGGQTEETWSAPLGGVMLGTFRLLRDGKAVFYEFLTLGVNGNGLSMRLKHFNPDLTSWEEKEQFVEFRYVRTAGKLAQFEGLTFERESDEALTIYLALRGKEVVVREEVFRMKRADESRATSMSFSEENIAAGEITGSFRGTRSP